MRRLSGIKPTGKIHLGNYFGAIKQFIANQNEDSFFFVADYHALNTLPDPKELEEHSLDIILDYLALGLTKPTIFLQSSVPAHTELSYILSSFAPLGLLQRAHAYKEKISKGEVVNSGLFYYPILMSADILIYKPDLVPVGRDQKQHVEIARDIAIKFNNHYGEIFKIPDLEIVEDLENVPGIDGQKMSKSYNNTIGLFEDEDSIKRKVARIVTDSKGVDEPKDYNSCAIYNILKLFLNQSEKDEIIEKYCTSVSYKYLKEELFSRIIEFVKPFKKRRDELKKSMDYVEQTLKVNSEKAKKIAASTMEEVKAAIGLIGRKY